MKEIGYNELYTVSVGDKFKQLSPNRYFNLGEIITAVGMSSGKMLFTSDRLKSTHMSREENKNLYGIPLEQDVHLIYLDKKQLKISKGKLHLDVNDLKFNKEKVMQKIDILEIQLRALKKSKDLINEKLNSLEILLD
jgi:hypothetical protein